MLCMWFWLVFFLAMALFYPFHLSYMSVLASLTVPEHCIISWCRFEGLFCCSCTALGDSVRLLVCCEVVSLYLSKSLAISLGFYSYIRNCEFLYIVVGGMSRLSGISGFRGFCRQVLGLMFVCFGFLEFLFDLSILLIIIWLASAVYIYVLLR